MSTVVSNEAKNLPPRPVDPPGMTGEQLLTQSTNKATDALKLKEKEEKGAEDALKLKEKDETITKWKGIAGAFGILSLAMSSALVLKIIEWLSAMWKFETLVAVYFILISVYFVRRHLMMTMKKY